MEDKEVDEDDLMAMLEDSTGEFEKKLSINDREEPKSSAVDGLA
jgi:hypothetical protein